MNKIKKEIIYLILCIASVIGSILSYILLLQYIPEFFLYINNNWNSGYTIAYKFNQCKIPFIKESFKVFKKHDKNFFNEERIINRDDDSDNLIKYNFNSTEDPMLIYCILNRSNYFDTKLVKYSENIDFSKCKYIDSLNNIACENYDNIDLITNTHKYTEVVFAQNQPCLDPRYYNLNMTFKETSYYYGKNKCPDGKTNKHYALIKSLSLDGILKDNHFEEIQNLLSDENKNQSLYIYGRNYIGINDKCRNKNFKDLNNNIDDVNQYIQNSIDWMGYINIIEVVFLLLFLNRFIVKYHNYINNINKEENQQNKELMPPYTSPIILILSLVMLGFHILVFTYFLNVRDFIDLFSDGSCFEDEAADLIKTSIICLNLARYTQIIVLCINGILAFKFGIAKGIKYAN